MAKLFLFDRFHVTSIRLFLRDGRLNNVLRTSFREYTLRPFAC